MTEVLLFSDDEKIFNLTNSVIDGRYKLTWCTYKSLEKKLYPYTDIVIMYFDKEMVKKGTFKTIVQVKGRLGQRIPILTLMEEAFKYLFPFRTRVLIFFPALSLHSGTSPAHELKRDSF